MNINIQVQRRFGDGKVIDVTMTHGERKASATLFSPQTHYTVQTNFSSFYEGRVRLRDAVAAIFEQLVPETLPQYVGQPFEVTKQNEAYVDSDTLSELRELLVQQRINTAGHGRRTRLQEQIDAIDAEFDRRADENAAGLGLSS